MLSNLLAQAQLPADAFSPYTALFSTFGFGGLMLVLFLRNKIYTETTYEELKTDRNMWRDRSDAAEERARISEREKDELAFELAKTTNTLLESIDKRARRKESG